METPKPRIFEGQEAEEAEFSKILKSASESVASEAHPDRNEDAVIDRADLGLFAVLDGVSGKGKGAGAEASRLTKEVVLRYLEEIVKNESSPTIKPEGWAHHLEESLKKASAELAKLQKQKDLAGADTTVVLVKIVQKDKKLSLVCASIGDSRLYLKKKDELFIRQLTRDDDYVEVACGNTLPQEDRIKLQQAVRKRIDTAMTEEDLHVDTPPGVDTELFFKFRNAISRSLAELSLPRQDVSKDIQAGIFEIRKGDLVILTTDGIHDNLALPEIEEIIQGSPGTKEIVQALVADAYERSRMSPDENIRAKPDDMTAVAVEIK